MPNRDANARIATMTSAVMAGKTRQNAGTIFARPDRPSPNVARRPPTNSVANAWRRPSLGPS